MTISMQIKTDVTWFFPQIFVSSRDIDDQILQSDWLRAFYVITKEQDFSQNTLFWRNFWAFSRQSFSEKFGFVLDS